MPHCLLLLLIHLAFICPVGVNLASDGKGDLIWVFISLPEKKQILLFFSISLKVNSISNTIWKTIDSQIKLPLSKRESACVAMYFVLSGFSHYVNKFIGSDWRDQGKLNKEVFLCSFSDHKNTFTPKLFWNMIKLCILSDVLCWRGFF